MGDTQKDFFLGVGAGLLVALFATIFAVTAFTADNSQLGLFPTGKNHGQSQKDKFINVCSRDHVRRMASIVKRIKTDIEHLGCGSLSSDAPQGLDAACMHLREAQKSLQEAIASCGSGTRGQSADRQGGKKARLGTQRPPAGKSTPVSPAQPVIRAIEPQKGPVGTAVTLSGVNFTTSGNVIRFGGGFIREPVDSEDQRILVFRVPASLVQCSPALVSDCTPDAFKTPLLAQQVQVVNTNGASNIVFFEVSEEEEPKL